MLHISSIIYIVSSLTRITRWQIVLGLCLALMIATFAMMNVNKAPDGDWIWYSEHYRMAASYSVSEYLSSKVGYVVTKWNEPTYYILAKTIYWATGGSLEALALSLIHI